jgi:hypothetical protein
MKLLIVIFFAFSCFRLGLFAAVGDSLTTSGPFTQVYTEVAYYSTNEGTVTWTVTFGAPYWNGSNIAIPTPVITADYSNVGHVPPTSFYGPNNIRIASVLNNWNPNTSDYTYGVRYNSTNSNYSIILWSNGNGFNGPRSPASVISIHVGDGEPLTPQYIAETPYVPEPVTETFYPITNNTATDKFLWLPQIQQGLVIPAGQTYNVPAGDGLFDGYYEFYDTDNIALDVDTGEYMPFGTPSKKGTTTFKQVESTEGSTIFDDIYSQNPDITIIEAEKPYKIETRDGKEWLVQKDNNKVIGNVETDTTTGKKTIEPFVDPSPPLQIDQPVDGVEARLDRLIEIEEQRDQNVIDGLEAAEDSRNALDSLTADAASDVQDIVGEINLTAPNISNARTLDFGSVETPLGVVEFRLTGIFTIFNTVMNIFREFAVWVLTLFFGFRGLRKFTEDAKQALTVPQMGVLTGVENLAPAATQTKFLIIAGVIAVTYVAMVGAMGVYYNSQVFSLMGSITAPSSPSIGGSGGFGDVVAWVDTNLFPIWLMVQYFIAYCVAYVVNFIAFFVAAIIVKLLNL